MNKRHHWARLAGLHFYIGSHFLKPETIVANVRSFFRNSLQVQRELDDPLSILCCGSGLGVPRSKDAQPIDPVHFRNLLNELLADREFATLLRDTSRLLVESGRYLIDPAGIFVTKVLYRKTSRGRTILICDGGLSNHLTAGGRQFQGYWRPIEAIKTAAARDSAKERVMICGPSRFARDILGEDVELPELHPGDLIGLLHSGAYGPRYSPQDFSGLEKAAEVIA